MSVTLNIPAFEEHRLLRGGRIQTIAGVFLPQNELVKPEQEILPVLFADGDLTQIIVDKPNVPLKRKSLVVLFHGLGGSADSGYNLRISEKLRNQGFTVARYCHRGSEPTLLPYARQIYHCGSREDLLTALRTLLPRFPDYEVRLIGFSLSGAVVLNLLGHSAHTVRQEFPNIRSALTICPPLDLESSSQRLSSLKNFLFDRYFSLTLTKQIRHKEHILPDLPKAVLFPWRGLRELDAGYTAKFGGFKSRDHYYETNSPERVIQQIDIPTTILGAADDPIICHKAYERGTTNPKINMILTNTGGHLGFISREKTSFGDYRWMDEFVVKWTNSTSS